MDYCEPFHMGFGFLCFKESPVFFLFHLLERNPTILSWELFKHVHWHWSRWKFLAATSAASHTAGIQHPSTYSRVHVTNLISSALIWLDFDLIHVKLAHTHLCDAIKAAFEQVSDGTSDNDDEEENDNDASQLLIVFVVRVFSSVFGAAWFEWVSVDWLVASLTFASLPAVKTCQQIMFPLEDSGVKAWGAMKSATNRCPHNSSSSTHFNQ